MYSPAQYTPDVKLPLVTLWRNFTLNRFNGKNCSAILQKYTYTCPSIYVSTHMDKSATVQKDGRRLSDW